MKTFNLLLGLLLGLIIGLLSTFGAIGWGLLYFMTDTKKDTKPSGADRTARQHKFKTTTTKGELFEHKYDTRKEAEDVIETLMANIERDGKTTVGDLANAMGYLQTFSDRQMGWRTLAGSHVTRDLYDNKYKIVFPTPETL